MIYSHMNSRTVPTCAISVDSLLLEPEARDSVELLLL